MGPDELLEPFNRLLGDISTPSAIRSIEGGGEIEPVWQPIADSGFVDAVRSEDQGGAGLALADVGGLLMALGHHAVPVPVGETMLARAFLGDAAPDGPIAFAALSDGCARAVPFGRISPYFLVETDGQASLYARDALRIEETGVHNSLAASIAVAAQPPLASVPVPPGSVRAGGALVRAAAIAGAAERMLDMTLAYANERVQFGKPIGRQQVVQQQLAVLAEHVIASRFAVQAACAAGLPFNLAAIAVAKQVCGEAAAQLANAAHAIHGAIGISEEYDLQLYSRRMHEWRLADGSGPWWSQLLGRLRLAEGMSSIDFVRGRLAAG